MQTALVLMAASLGLAGCADQMLSDGRIISNTAAVLGQPPGVVTIADRRSDTTNTYYTARTPRGAYSCSINGGDALSLGIVMAPQCSRE